MFRCVDETMRIITAANAPVNYPLSVWAYFDRVQVWLQQPADSTTIAELKMSCGYVHQDNRPAPFDPAYRQRLDFKRPSDTALLWLAGQDGAVINETEPALDYVFATWRERDQQYDFWNWSLVRRWHGRRQHVYVHPGASETRYDALRSAPNSTKLYKEKFSRITGELYCLHVEWRAHGVRGVRSIGIHSPADLLNFDHRQFWQKRLRFYDVEPERLGRHLRMRASGQRGRGRPYDDDQLRGEITLRCVDSIQELIDDYRIPQRVLIHISNEPYLYSI